LCIPAADALDDELRGTSVHVVGALDEMKLVRARCARRIRVERGEIRVCIALRHNLVCRAVKDEAAAMPK
jgi:hypothetical protein